MSRVLWASGPMPMHQDGGPQHLTIKTLNDSVLIYQNTLIPLSLAKKQSEEPPNRTLITIIIFLYFVFQFLIVHLLNDQK